MSHSEDTIQHRIKTIKRRDNLKFGLGFSTGIVIVMTLISGANSYKAGEVDELLWVALVLILVVIYGFSQLKKFNAEIESWRVED